MSTFTFLYFDRSPRGFRHLFSSAGASALSPEVALTSPSSSSPTVDLHRPRRHQEQGSHLPFPRQQVLHRLEDRLLLRRPFDQVRPFFSSLLLWALSLAIYTTNTVVTCIRFGEVLRGQVEERLSFYENGSNPTKNSVAMQKVRWPSFQVVLCIVVQLPVQATDLTTLLHLPSSFVSLAHHLHLTAAPLHRHSSPSPHQSTSPLIPPNRPSTPSSLSKPSRATWTSTTLPLRRRNASRMMMSP